MGKSDDNQKLKLAAENDRENFMVWGISSISRDKVYKDSYHLNTQ